MFKRVNISSDAGGGRSFGREGGGWCAQGSPLLQLRTQVGMGLPVDVNEGQNDKMIWP